MATVNDQQYPYEVTGHKPPQVHAQATETALVELKETVRQYLSTDPAKSTDRWCELSNRMATLSSHREGQKAALEQVREAVPSESDIAIFYTNRVWFRQGEDGSFAGYGILLGDANKSFHSRHLSDCVNQVYEWVAQVHTATRTEGEGEK